MRSKPRKLENTNKTIKYVLMCTGLSNSSNKVA